jgi:Tol biopolymer transport system component
MKTRIFTLAAIFLLAACATPKPIANPVRVVLVADGTRAPVTAESSGATVRDVLRQANVTLNDLDRVRPPESVAISDGMTITVTRILQHTETQTQTIPFTQQTVRDATIPAGQSKVLQAGRNGALTITFRLTFEDGAQTERVETRREVVEQPVTEVVLVGIENVLSAVPFSGTIAYITNNNAFVMRQATSNRRALTTSGDLDGRVFALSPDGKWLLFTRALTKTTEGSPINSLWVVDTVLANAAPKLLKTPGVIFAEWSPDGDMIAYSTATTSSGPPGWRAANDVWIAGFRAGTLSAPEKILEPATGGMFGWWGANYFWSPDGKSIAIGSTDSIAVVDLKTRKRSELASFSAYNTFSNWAWTPTVAWTPDSKFVVTVIHGPSPAGEPAESSPVFDVWSLAADGSLKARLAGESGMWAAPHVAPGSIIFGRAQAPYASADSRYDLFRMDRDGSNRLRLFPIESKPGLQGKPDFDFSPDGSQIVIIYQRDLYFVNVSTGASQQLTTEGNLQSPCWSR